MYDFNVAMRRFQGLIRWCAKRYSVPGSVVLNSEDLEAEGYVVLVGCCQSYPPYRFRFARYFKRSLYNHLRNLSRDTRRQKRRGEVVSLESALPVLSVPPDGGEDFLLQSLKPILSLKAYSLLSQIVSPSREVEDYAWREFCRRNKLHSLGQSTVGFNKFSIKLKHIRVVLGFSRRDMENALGEIRSVYQTRRKHEKVS